jgi:hypothetical protein
MARPEPLRPARGPPTKRRTTEKPADSALSAAVRGE